MITGLLIVGLGNPGNKYTNTRHNLGANWVKRLCQHCNSSINLNTKLSAYVAHVSPSIICIIPDDYMNNSGFIVQKFVNYHKHDLENILVVHDELDLNPGEIRLKLSGGHGGHNGLRNIIEQLQTNKFKRLRIGIGHPKIKEQVADYVLSPATLTEQININSAIERSLNILPELIKFDWQKIMQFLH